MPEFYIVVTLTVIQPLVMWFITLLIVSPVQHDINLGIDCTDCFDTSNNIISIHPTGAGIYDQLEERALPNNSLIIAKESGSILRFDCISNSSQPSVKGWFTDLNEQNVTRQPFTARTGGGRPGTIQVTKHGILNKRDEGIYTCHIPDANNVQFDVNIGVYSSGFNSKLRIACT